MTRLLPFLVAGVVFFGAGGAHAQPEEDEAPAAEAEEDEAPAAEAEEDDFDLDAILADEEASGEEEDWPEEEEDPFTLPVLGETTFSLTNTTILEYRRNDFASTDFAFIDHDADRFAAAGTERLELAAQGEEIRVSTRLDAFLPISRSTCPMVGVDPLCDLSFDARPERFNVYWEPGDFALDLGDSHAVFGRGIALTMRKEDILGVDNALRGAYAQYESDRVFARVLGGLANPQNLDPLELSIRPDPEDIIIGAEGGFRLGEDQDIEIGTHAVRVWFEPVGDPADTEIVADVFDWHWTTPSLFDGALVLYGEVNAMRRDDVDPAGTDARNWGRAIYGSAQLNVGNTTVQVEWKDYRDFLLAPTNTARPEQIYSGAPSLDRDSERFRGVHNSRGGRAEVNYAFQPGPWSVGAIGIVYGHSDEPGATGLPDPWDGVLVTHGLLQVTRRSDVGGGGDEDLVGDEGGQDGQDGQNGEDDESSSDIGWTIDVVAGYRRETYLDDSAALLMDRTGQGDLDWEVMHAEVDTTVSVDEHSFELRVEHREETKRLFALVGDGLLDYRRGGVTLTYAFKGKLTISPALRWDTEFRMQRPALYPGLEARYEIVEGTHVRVFGGRTPGGIICSGGICRDVPPFEGVLGELVLRI